ncbi:anthranilate phosphoribosyltransferase [Streptomonospora wellingtoniae]|uniref:Anthranilate phosphoribosyltransferase n=1 Tax=Streptomonospora wellingtoniae TaxID=3075544 RepID=A0ABU2KP69_9ACTN|nr:anthranilate phosphoribosyltransferase [Streptomonospora sp. DSM 45055]MDT0301053.1 anthranilate phosphoribosyltransferase [Streptomonospora sp. DSM 45055]
MSTTERTWSELITALLEGRPLSAEDTGWAMNEIMSGSATDVQIAGFAVALRAKGAEVAEVTGLAEGMFRHAVRIAVPGSTVDVVGTGGDRAHTVNISTMAAIVAAAAGAKVVKHGNRAASSSCGTADVLERLGVVIDLAPEHTARVAEEAGITFCFAPLFHPSLRHASKTRKELGVPTVFNFLGPLTNPARPGAAAVGVFDEDMCETIAGVFARRGTSAMVFRGDDGLDELTTTGTSRIWTVHGGEVSHERFDPADLGIERAEPGALRGGDVEYNARVVRELVSGGPAAEGAVRDAVLLNASAAVAATTPGFGTAGPAETLGAALEITENALTSGAAARVLDDWVEISQSHAKRA